MDSYRKQFGKFSEHEACHFLQARGFILIQQNYFCRYGEIDLIMQDQDDIVFVEVRSRSRLDYGHAIETINHDKIKKLIKTGQHFLQARQWLYKVNSRFDVVAIHQIASKIQIEWVKNAFSVEI